MVSLSQSSYSPVASTRRISGAWPCKAAVQPFHLPDAQADGVALGSATVEQEGDLRLPAQVCHGLATDYRQKASKPFPWQSVQNIGEQRGPSQRVEELISAKAHPLPCGHNDTANLHRHPSASSRSSSRQSARPRSRHRKGSSSLRSAASTRLCSNSCHMAC